MEFKSETEAIACAKELIKSVDNNLVVVERNNVFVVIEGESEMAITDRLICVIEKRL